MPREPISGPNGQSIGKSRGIALKCSKLIAVSTRTLEAPHSRDLQWVLLKSWTTRNAEPRRRRANLRPRSRGDHYPKAIILVSLSSCWILPYWASKYQHYQAIIGNKPNFKMWRQLHWTYGMWNTSSSTTAIWLCLDHLFTQSTSRSLANIGRDKLKLVNLILQAPSLLSETYTLRNFMGRRGGGEKQKKEMGGDSG